MIKIRIAAVCNTDKEVLRGYKPDFNGIMGHEFVGEVIKSGRPELVGRRVVGELNAGCGHCLYCRTGRRGHCDSRRVIGLAGKDGCFAEYMTLETGLLHEVPDTLRDEEAVFTEPLAAALEIPTQVHLKPSDSVAVIGDGRLAFMIAQVIALTGADLTVIGRHEEKLKQFSGFAHVTTDLPDTYEVVIDATGSPTGILTAQKVVRHKGTIVLKSTYAGDTKVNMSDFVVNEVTITGSRCGPFAPALNLLSKHYVQFPPIQLYDLTDYGQAFQSKAFKAGFSFTDKNCRT
ncbi:alcohol dehydrogenase catalytic domain-containing protein [Diplocloster modestus]|uniref:Alcohol dehydrogenase catalytic domain-containing protein n=1 Tax=Diplocloster modestus TaxID=2850322 RepID=A0ABS6K423_9FIRM|nr:alcohol dehydrogenase catalytic domain-containing protein [Diplocloster modestus]MBU9725238.1 alcohol dehydrogenase catalytic domain-containing protein [Diplocloster modestus]